MYRDRKGQFWQEFINFPKEIRHARFPRPYCVELCGRDLRRPHFTCLFCRIRKIYEGKLPSKLPIDPPVTLLPYANRRFARVRAFLVRKLFNIAELLS